jgi:MoxR-like ATPase
MTGLPAYGSIWIAWQKRSSGVATDITEDRHDYLAADDLVVAIHLALQLGRPLFLEGEAGVGKTEVAKVLAA